jgi:hypothetical protein
MAADRRNLPRMLPIPLLTSSFATDDIKTETKEEWLRGMQLRLSRQAPPCLKRLDGVLQALPINDIRPARAVTRNSDIIQDAKTSPNATPHLVRTMVRPP